MDTEGIGRWQENRKKNWKMRLKHCLTLNIAGNSQERGK